MPSTLPSLTAAAAPQLMPAQLAAPPVVVYRNGHCIVPLNLKFQTSQVTVEREFANMKLALDNLLEPYPELTEKYKYHVLLEHLKLPEAQ